MTAATDRPEMKLCRNSDRIKGATSSVPSIATVK